MKDSKENLNYVSQANSRIDKVEKEVLEITAGEAPKKTIIKNESFDHCKWVKAELKDLYEHKNRMLSVVTIEGAVQYDRQD